MIESQIPVVAPRCSLHDDAVCLFSALFSLLDEQGEVTIRQQDLPADLLGLTRFRDHTVIVANGLTPGQRRATLAHELIHLRRGPVTREDAEQEELAVQRETAELLIPAGPALAQLQREWTDADIQELAARFVVDSDAVETALGLPRIPEQRSARTSRER